MLFAICFLWLIDDFVGRMLVAVCSPIDILDFSSLWIENDLRCLLVFGSN